MKINDKMENIYYEYTFYDYDVLIENMVSFESNEFIYCRTRYLGCSKIHN